MSRRSAISDVKLTTASLLETMKAHAASSSIQQGTFNLNGDFIKAVSPSLVLITEDAVPAFSESDVSGLSRTITEGCSP